MSVLKGAMDLVSQVAFRKEAARNRARERYPKLLEEQSTNPKLAEELHEALGHLGKDVAQLMKDRSTVQEYRHWEGIKINGVGLDGPRQQAIKAVADHNAQTKRLLEQRQAEFHRLQAASSELENRFLNAQRAVNEMNTLKEHNPDLLMYEQRLTYADLG